MVKLVLSLLCALLIAETFALPTSYEDGLEKPLSPEQIAKLNNLALNENAEEFSGQIEGDLLIDEEEWSTYNGRLEPTLRWPNNIAPFWINDTFFNQAQMDYIRQAAAYLESRTCIRFPERPVPLDEDHIYVTGDSVGCAALVGRRGGGQRIRLQPNNIESGCFRFFTIIHEFLHALGFHHMQNVYDRDTYIRINWENVRPESVGSFDTRPSSQVSHFAVPYDVGSVLHYSQTAFSANGQPTMTALWNPHGRTMGQRLEATPEDILRVNRMYNCPTFPN